MRTILSVFFLCVAFMVNAAKVDSVRVYSESMKRDVRTVIVKPDIEGTAFCPVVYLLHGFSGNEKDWINSKANLPALADRYQIIIVCPDGKNSWYWDSPQDSTYRYETFISSELPAYVDSNYSTITRKSGRAITGLSMGGHGALWNGIRHTNVFGAAGSMSGGVDIRPFPNNWEMKNQLGEYATNKEVWENHTVINQIGKLKKGDLALIIDCGVEDFFFNVNNNLHQALLKNGTDHDYIVRPGNHNWEYWVNAIEYQLLFFRKYFNSDK